MASFATERVIKVEHWTDRQFTITATRSPGFRFENGQFVMVGLEVAGRPLLRAYSIASANHEDHLEFLSIKVSDGPLTSRLKDIRDGDALLVSRKATGTLLLHDLKPGKRLYLLSTGTGVAPFLSILKDPDVYERFERVVLVHGVRWVRETEIARSAVQSIKAHEILGESARGKLDYYPTVTREPFINRGRVTTQLVSKKIFYELGIPPMDPGTDRVMVCGSPGMIKDTSRLLESWGLRPSPYIGEPGDFVIERAFVER